ESTAATSSMPPSSLSLPRRVDRWSGKDRRDCCYSRLDRSCNPALSTGCPRRGVAGARELEAKAFPLDQIVPSENAGSPGSSRKRQDRTHRMAPWDDSLRGAFGG